MKVRVEEFSALLLVAFFHAGCATPMEPVSKRAPAGFSKAGDNSGLADAGPREKPKQLYVKREEIAIVPKDTATESGSLYSSDDARNFLFTGEIPAVPGRYLTVHIAGASATENAASAKSKGASPDSETDGPDGQLLKELPDMKAQNAPGQPVTSFKMQVVGRLENGDVIAEMQRQSMSGTEARDIQIRAKIPYMRLASQDKLTTEDLVDVQWLESTGSEVVESRSATWEQDYTDRLTRFDEVMSQQAVALEEKRAKLEEASIKIRDRMKAMIEEKKTFVRERDKLLESEKRAQGELVELKRKFEEQSKQLQELQPKGEDAKDEGANSPQATEARGT